MINNRQGGRRRGRGGQRGPNLGGGQPGNRQDNRQRGNAAQLLEKYKSMARDSQLAGDRVQTEYYLQYADHYFRVVNENRSRFEDQRPRRDSEDDEGDEDLIEAGESEDSGDERPERNERPDRGERQDRGGERRPRDRNRYERDDQAARGPRRPGTAHERMNGDDDDVIPLDVLPPAIGADGPASSPPEAGKSAPSPAAVRAPRVRPRTTTTSLPPPRSLGIDRPRAVLGVQRDEGEQTLGDLDLGLPRSRLATTSILTPIDVRPTRSTSA